MFRDIIKNIAVSVVGTTLDKGYIPHVLKSNVVDIR
jgi:hypothetical protein